LHHLLLDGGCLPAFAGQGLCRGSGLATKLGGRRLNALDGAGAALIKARGNDGELEGELPWIGVIWRSDAHGWDIAGAAAGSCWRPSHSVLAIPKAGLKAIPAGVSR